MLANIIRNSKKSVGGGGGGGIVIDGGDPYYSAVSLMLSMDGTNGSTTFTDSSLNALTVTPVGNAQISTTQSKYGGASLALNGTNSLVSIADSSLLEFGSGDFTVEAWIYPTSNSGMRTIFSKTVNGTSPLLFTVNGGNVVYYLSSTGTTHNIASGVSVGSVSLNTWSHVAISRSGSTVRAFVNGTAGTLTTTSASLVDNTGLVRIGSNFYINPVEYFSGYIDDFRISRFARYVSNFTPPTAALPTTASSTVADPYYNYTSLLLHMDGTNTSTSFTDSGPNALAVTAVGNAQISTAQSKYGGASGYFDGTGDYLSLASNSQFAVGTSDFTIEFWIYITARKSYGYIIWTKGGGDALYISFDLAGNFLRLTNAGTVFAVTSTLNLNQWYHVAVVRSSGSSKIYVDGIGGTAVACAASFVQSGPLIGGDSTANYFQGYIDDLRITKYARFTSAFTPPAAALPDIYNPNTTLPVTGAALWLDASQQNTLFTDAGTTPVTTSGQSVYQWNDLSGNNRHAIQATSGNRPTWSPPASGINGLGAVAFNGSQWLGFTNTFTNFTIFVVYKNTDTINGSVLVGKSSGTSNYLFASTASRIEMNGGGTQQASSTRTNGTQWDYSTFKYDGSTVTAYSSGTTGTSNSVGATSFSPDRIGYYATASYALEGSISEFIVYPTALSDSDRTYVVNYIKSKWNL